MREDTTPRENDALFAFMKATVSRVDTGRLGVRNALTSVAIVISAWARTDPELHKIICKDDDPPN